MHKSVMQIPISIILAVFLCGVSNAAALDDVAIAYTQIFKKNTFLFRDGHKINLAKDMPVHTGDIIVSGPNGYLQLMFADKTVITAGQNSVFKIVKYYTKLNDKKNSELKLIYGPGNFRIWPGKISKRNRQGINAKTPDGRITLTGKSAASFITPANPDDLSKAINSDDENSVNSVFGLKASREVHAYASGFKKLPLTFVDQIGNSYKITPGKELVLTDKAEIRGISGECKKNISNLKKNRKAQIPKAYKPVFGSESSSGSGGDSGSSGGSGNGGGGG